MGICLDMSFPLSYTNLYILPLGLIWDRVECRLCFLILGLEGIVVVVEVCCCLVIKLGQEDPIGRDEETVAAGIGTVFELGQLSSFPYIPY